MPAYLCGLVVYAVGFYWIYDTVAAFGGFGPIVSGLIFALYVMSGAILFVVFAWAYHNLGPTLDAFALRSPIAIVVAELITVRLFYWHFGHTQVAFTPFVQIAGLGGAMLVSFVMFWLAEAGVRVVVFGEWRRAFLLPLAAFAIATRLRNHDDERPGLARRRKARSRARARAARFIGEARTRRHLAEPGSAV